MSRFRQISERKVIYAALLSNFVRIYDFGQKR